MLLELVPDVAAGRSDVAPAAPAPLLLVPPDAVAPDALDAALPVTVMRWPT